MQITNEYNNAWFHAYIINLTLFENTVCAPFHIVPEQGSKCSRTVNGAASRKHQRSGGHRPTSRGNFG